MIASISTFFDCTEKEFWKKIIEIKSLQFVSAPVLSFRPLEKGSLEGEWITGRTFELKVYFLNFLPLGHHRIKIITIDRESNTIVSNESGTMAPVWNHTVRFHQVEDGKLKYTDEIDIKAG